MPDFVLGLVVGVALGLVVVGFIAIGSFDRGWDAALRRTALTKIPRLSVAQGRRTA